MPLIRIQTEPGVKHIFIASDNISDLATVELVTTAGAGRRVAMGSDANPHLAAGVARGSALSGKLVRVITQGIVSGVKTVQNVLAGDRLTIATSGRVTPFNTITTSGLISGYLASGFLSGYIFNASGTVGVALSGYVSVTAFNTGRLVGRALTSGLSGLGIQMLVCLE